MFDITRSLNVENLQVENRPHLAPLADPYWTEYTPVRDR